MSHHDIVAESPNPLGPSEQTVPPAADGARLDRAGVRPTWVHDPETSRSVAGERQPAALASRPLPAVARNVRREGIGSAFVTAGNNPTVRGNELIVMYNVDTY